MNRRRPAARVPRHAAKDWLYLLTSNRKKFLEARYVLSRFGIRLKRLDFKPAEIQADRIEEVVKKCAEEASRQTTLPALIEDSGLFIASLKGFPGPYSAYTLKTIGLRGVLKLMEGVRDRRACFVTALAFVGHPRGEFKIFLGKVWGNIAHEARGTSGFGFDPIFIPHGSGRSFGEMSLEEKSACSHRARALQAFAEWYSRRRSRKPET